MSILVQKNKEYSSTTDRLYNFKEAGKVMNCEPEQALFAFMTKHIISFRDLCDDPCSATRTLIDEKITDVVNYALLLEALLVERKCR